MGEPISRTDQPPASSHPESLLILCPQSFAPKATAPLPPPTDTEWHFSYPFTATDIETTSVAAGRGFPRIPATETICESDKPTVGCRMEVIHQLYSHQIASTYPVMATLSPMGMHLLCVPGFMHPLADLG